jgi:hypothetical protein
MSRTSFVFCSRRDDASAIIAFRLMITEAAVAGEAKRRKISASNGRSWPHGKASDGEIQLHVLPPLAAINSDRIRELTGDSRFPAGTQIVLKAFRAVFHDRSFHVGFCVGDGDRFSAIGLAVIERLLAEAPGEALHVVPVVHKEVAWDIVLRHLRTFSGKVLLFAFSNSLVYDAGTAEMYYSGDIGVFLDGERQRRLTEKERRKIKDRAAQIRGEPPPPTFYEMPGLDPLEEPWIFEMMTPTGKNLRLTVWNGRREFVHEIAADVVELVGGSRIAIVQVGSPVGVAGRSSIALSEALASDFDGIVHWARDTATYQSIVKELVEADLQSVRPPDLPPGWKPEIVIMPVNDRT